MAGIPAASTGQGQALTTGPTDACKTPSPAGPVPLPYPNIAMLSDGDGTSKVKIQGKNTLREGDSMSMSTGDEPGVAGGVVSSKFKGKCEIVKGWAKVKADGKPVAHQGSPCKHNCGGSPNTVGLIATVMQ